VRDAIRVNITFKTHMQWIRRDIQETMIYAHGRNRGGKNARSPLDL